MKESAVKIGLFHECVVEMNGQFVLLLTRVNPNIKIVEDIAKATCDCTVYTHCENSLIVVSLRRGGLGIRESHSKIEENKYSMIEEEWDMCTKDLSKFKDMISKMIMGSKYGI